MKAAENEFANLPLVIVGTGLAGYTVAREVRKLDRQRPIVLISQDDGTAYSKPMLSNALAQGKSAAALANFDAGAMAQQLDATVLTHRVVGQIHVDAHAVEFQGQRLGYSQLVLALGADPRQPSLPGAAASEILSINDLRDYTRYRQKLETCRSVAILGAGLIGVEFANDLAVAGFGVSLIDPAAAPLARLLPTEAGDALARTLSRHGVAMHLGNLVTEMDYAGLGYRLRLASGITIDADLVVSAIGLAPRVALARAAGLQVGQGIVTDAHCRTSAPDVFALGDCAEHDGKVQPYVLPIMHAARALAATLCGRPTPVRFPVMPVTVKTPAIPVVVAPAPADADNWTVDIWHEPEGESLRALCVDPGNGRVLGFSLLGAATARKNDLVRVMEAGEAGEAGETGKAAHS